jgi:hypothetical protein
MKNNDFIPITEQFVKDMRDILDMKDIEYSSDTDRLYNFKIAANMSDETPERALWGMLVKHLISVRDICYHPESVTRGLLKEKTIDTANYMVLLNALIMERHNDFIPLTVNVAPLTPTHQKMNDQMFTESEE